MMRHCKAYRLTYHDDIICKMRCIEFLHFFFRNSEFWNRNSDFSIFQQRNLRKNFRPESSESKAESEFRFQWGSHKLEPKIGIPNQDDNDNAAMMTMTTIIIEDGEMTLVHTCGGRMIHWVHSPSLPSCCCRRPPAAASQQQQQGGRRHDDDQLGHLRLAADCR